MTDAHPDHERAESDSQTGRNRSQHETLLYSSETVTLRGLTMRRRLVFFDRLVYEYDRTAGTRALYTKRPGRQSPEK